MLCVLNAAFSGVVLFFTLFQQWEYKKMNMPFLQIFLKLLWADTYRSLCHLLRISSKGKQENDKAYSLPRDLMFRLNWSLKGILTRKASNYKSVPRVFSVISGKSQFLLVQEAIISTQKIVQGKKERKLISDTKYWKKKAYKEMKIKEHM